MMATSEFGKAFAAARKAGDKTFEFNGKKYTTKTAEDVSKEKKGEIERSRRADSDMMRDLTKVEQNMPAGTSDLAKQKIAESKRRATEDFATKERAEDMKKYKPRRNTAPAGNTLSMKKGGSINGIAKRGLTKCKTV
jgi:hypothetical protein